jgi:hypothetical protein
MKNTAEKIERKLDDNTAKLIEVLRSLYRSGERRTYNIDEITEASGLSDEKEAQRSLFILEGQKLVSPFPEGDFTSKNWMITQIGTEALSTIEQQMKK